MGAPRSHRGGGIWKKRGLRATFVALVSLAFVIGQQGPARADDPLQQALKQKQELERAVAESRATAERYRAAADAYQAAVSAAQARISDLASQEAAARSEADALALDIQITEEQLALASFQLDETRANADSLNTQAAALQQQLVAREALYATHLRVTYQQAMVSPLQMLLSSTSLTDFADRVQALIFINRQDTQIAKDINTLQADTERQLADAKMAEAQIAGLQKQVLDQQRALADQKAQYDALVKQAQASIAQQSRVASEAATNRDAQRQSQTAATGQTAELETQLREADARYEQLAAAAGRGAGLGAFNGTLAVWPLIGPITSPFGARWGGFHNGIDIARPMYTPIVAAAAGQVVTVGHPYLAYGDTAEVIIIAHGSNFQTLYGHLDDVTRPPVVKVGQWVYAGQVIAYEGMTGWTTGPHLHFMTIVNGRAVDPLQYLP
jgi:murein DD-endopeptidase MepM/ murein hydrolase activator NlpD